MNPQVVYEDEAILVINKPAGMVVNKAETSRKMFTLHDWVEERFKVKSLKADVTSSEFADRVGIVHRLDKETSGLMLIAKNEQSFLILQSQFKEKKVHKTYLALCHGKVTPSEGTVSAPVGRIPWDRKKFGVIPMGRDSVTDYKVKEYKIFEFEKKEEILSFVEAYPRTGRTHQIRVHFRYLGHPIFADTLYAGRTIIRRDRKILERHFLHATKISFLHPEKAVRVEFESDLPSELSSFLDSLKNCYT